MPKVSLHTLLSVLGALSIAIVGCGERGPTPAPPAAESDAAPQQSDQSPIQTTAAPVPVDDIAASAGRERILLLTPGGPVVVDLWLTIDGEPHTRPIEDLVARVMTAGDTDRDGVSTWKEFTSNTPFLFGALAGLTADTLNQAGPWIERFDTHTDGQIDPDEARAWLGRGGGGSARPLAMRTYRSQSSSPRSRSRVWRLLDVDRDGQLSADEMDQATARLLTRDADDNHLLHPGDLDTLRDQIRSADANAMQSRRDAGRHAALMLDDHSDWYRVWYILSDQYAARADLSPSSFPLFPTLFAELDADDDGDLAADEFAVLATREPHLTLRVAFGKSAATGQYAPSIELLEQSPDLAPAIASSPRRVVLPLTSSRLDISVHDIVPASDFTSSAAERLARLDKDGNAALDEEEVKAEDSPNPDLFRTLDTDESGMVTAAELLDSLRLSQALVRSQISLLVHDLGDSVFSVLDTDHDGRLGEREIAAAPGRLRSLDRDGNESLSDSEIPRQMTVAFVRGENPNARTFNVPTSTPRAPGAADPPGWFVRGDFNQDGEISRREFLGSLDQFNQLDSNANGYIDSDEAAAARDD